ncbi:hypothetical protein Lal_00002104 [Lupinus albus]|nr:hypothetical protein Lal_00002104 [Lupinus albus]
MAAALSTPFILTNSPTTGMISIAIAAADGKELMRKLPNFIYDEEKALEKTQKVLALKIEELNSAIDDVSAQLREQDAPNGVPVNSEVQAAT